MEARDIVAAAAAVRDGAIGGRRIMPPSVFWWGTVEDENRRGEAWIGGKRGGVQVSAM